jgi:gp32 DNA binding protein like
MASNFSSLRKNRNDLLTKLAQTAKDQSSNKFAGDDERFWKLTTDQKTGFGYARLRFLPPAKNEEISWARLFSHGFQGPSGSWYFENCPTTHNNRPCPVCKQNNALWNTGVEADKDVARTRKRKLNYISNVLIIEDPAHPENNGKVFLFKYGKKIHEKIMELIEPQFPDSQPSNPFDMWEGADFKLKAAKVGGFPNYDKSSFADQSELFANDPQKEAKQEEVWNQERSLAEFTAEDQFKTYEALEQRFNIVMGGSDAPRRAADAIEREDSYEDQDDEGKTPEPVAARAERQRKTARPSKENKVAIPEPVVPTPPADEDEDDIKDFFASVLEDEA